MMNCSTIGCTNRSDTPFQEGISFHKIPSSKNIKFVVNQYFQKIQIFLCFQVILMKLA